MAVREITPDDFPAWVEMRGRLWPDEDDLVSETADVRRGRLGVLVWEEAGALVGFAEVSMRSVVDGATSSPVGYLEGWWVDEAHRRRGIGRALVSAAEDWARRRGAVEMGSDSDHGNVLGEAGHRSLGFVEQGTVVQWLKPLEPAGGNADDMPARGSEVTLVPITSDNVRRVAELAVAPSQRGFVAPNAISIAEASMSDRAWLRAIYVGEVPVGLVLLWEDAEQPMYYLWRFMIDARYQGRGFGERAMELVVDRVRSLGAARLHLSYVPLSGGPGEFYRRLGFVDSGKVEGGEVEAILELTS